MATLYSVLAWIISGMAEPGGLPSMRSPRVGHDWSDLAATAVMLFDFLSSILPLAGCGNFQKLYDMSYGNKLDLASVY